MGTPANGPTPTPSRPIEGTTWGSMTAGMPMAASRSGSQSKVVRSMRSVLEALVTSVA